MILFQSVHSAVFRCLLVFFSHKAKTLVYPLALIFNLRRPKRGLEQSLTPPSYFFKITFLRVKQNQQDFTYSYLDKQQIAKRRKNSNTS